MNGNNAESRTIFCGNLSDEVTDAILFELFLQAGPVECVRRPRDPNGNPKSFGFVVYKHECSVPYAVELYRGTKLFNKYLNINTRSTLRHVPVLDSHLVDLDNSSEQLNESRDNRHSGSDHRRRNDDDYGSRRDSDSRSHRERDRERGRHRDEDRKTHKERDSQPSSWAELNALRGQGQYNGNQRHDLQSSSRSRASDFIPDVQGAHSTPDFNTLLQMGQQMMIPGISPQMVPGLMALSAGLMGLGPGLGMGANMFPSMQGGFEGGRVSPDRDRRWRDSHNNWHGRRDHPYNDRRHERRDDHHRHDRGYSSSQSSHERERRDRRSR